MKANNFLIKSNFAIGNRLHYIFIFMLSIFISGCESFVELDSAGSELSTKAVFDNPSAANTALTAIYAEVIRTRVPLDIATRTGLYSDELTDYSNNIYVTPWYQNGLDVSVVVPSWCWNNFYKFIYQANSVIEGSLKSQKLSSALKQQLIAEALFIRAYSYFYLVNLYGDVPLILTTDYDLNARMARSNHNDVYEQIIIDLKEARQNLYSNYVGADGLTPTVERVRPNQAAASALLARVFLYKQDYPSAEEAASFVIDESALYDIVALNEAFLKNNREAIWQIPQSTTQGNPNTLEAADFVLLARPNNYTVSNYLLNAFEHEDKRREYWIGVFRDETTESTEEYYFPNKYKVKNDPVAIEYSTALRLAEQYLIRAEARVHQGNIPGALSDLNVIRKRAGLMTSTTNDVPELLNVILHERQVELFTEWGHRWLDLKRTGTVDKVMGIVTPQKGGTWDSYKQFWPIQQTEIDRNSNLVQTLGYD